MSTVKKIALAFKVLKDGTEVQDFVLLDGYYDREVEMCRALRKEHPKLQQGATLFSQHTWNSSVS